MPVSIQDPVCPGWMYKIKQFLFLFVYLACAILQGKESVWWVPCLCPNKTLCIIWMHKVNNLFILMFFAWAILQGKEPIWWVPCLCLNNTLCIIRMHNVNIFFLFFFFPVLYCMEKNLFDELRALQNPNKTLCIIWMLEENNLFLFISFFFFLCLCNAAGRLIPC
jgi:hypothetical protein